MPEARVGVDPIFAAFGLAAIVVRPGDDPIVTTAVWMPEGTTDGGVEIVRAVPRKILAFRVDEVPSAPYGTLVMAADIDGGDAKVWRVDEIGQVEADLIRVIVAPRPTTEFLESWGKV